MATISRRNLLRFAGGASIGTFLSPLPWKLLDDTSIWTQNWSWIPKPPKGAITFKYTNCALCGSGCAAQVRCVAGQPVSLAGVRSNPASQGFLCPLGLLAHHLRYHPDRFTQPLLRTSSGDLRPAALADATRVVSSRLRDVTQPQAAGYVACVDATPGSAVSTALQALLAGFPRSAYLVPPDHRDGVRVLGSMVESTESWALDIQGSKTVLSFGAPLLEGWGTSGRLVTQFLGSDRKTRLIHAEPNGSLTARAADVWLPIKPGSEAALALGLANLLIEKKLYDPSVVCPDLAPDSAYRSLLREFPPERVAEITGIAPGAVVETAQSLAEGGPALVVSRGCVTGSASLAEERAIQALNLLLGNLDQPGGVIARRNTVPEARPVPTTTTPGRQTAGILRSLAAVPDGSVDLLIVDASFSSPPFAWGAIERKLQPGKSMVVVLASLPNAWTSHADVVIPAPVFGETIDEVREGFDSPEESFSLSARLTEPLPGLFRLHDFVALLATSAGLGAQAGSSQEVIRQKILAIHQAGKGTVFSPAEGQAKPISEFASSDDLFKALTEGARWEGELPEPKKSAPRRFSLSGAGAGDLELMRQVVSQRGGLGDSVPSGYPLAVLRSDSRVYDSSVSPLLAKITWESGLHPTRQAFINPATAAENGVVSGATAALRTPHGKTNLPFVLSEDVMPGAVLLAGPAREDELELATGPDGASRVMPGRLEEV